MTHYILIYRKKHNKIYKYVRAVEKADKQVRKFSYGRQLYIKIELFLVSMYSEIKKYKSKGGG